MLIILIPSPPQLTKNAFSLSGTLLNVSKRKKKGINSIKEENFSHYSKYAILCLSLGLSIIPVSLGTFKSRCIWRLLNVSRSRRHKLHITWGLTWLIKACTCTYYIVRWEHIRKYATSLFLTLILFMSRVSNIPEAESKELYFCYDRYQYDHAMITMITMLHISPWIKPWILSFKVLSALSCTTIYYASSLRASKKHVTIL